MTNRLHGRRLDGIETRLMPVASVDSAARTARVVFTTGARVRRYDFVNGRAYLEELVVTPDAVDLSRLNSGAPVLNTHGQFDLRDVIGVVESASIANGEGHAVIRFSERADVEPIFRDVQAGILRNVSVGYSIDIDKIERIAPTDSQPLEVRRVTRWKPHEISLVPLGADAMAGVRSAARNLPAKEPAMDEPDTDDTLAERAETQRQHVILGMAQLPAVRSLGDEFVRSMIGDRSVTIDEARRRVFDELARRDEATYVRGPANLPERFDFGRESNEPNPRIGLMIEALCARHGGPEPSVHARPYQRMRLVDMARELLEERGVRTTLLSNDRLVERAMTTSDFPELLLGTGNRILRRSYESYDGGIRQLAKQSTARDFRAKTALQLGEAPTLEKVNESGEFKFGSLVESKETYALATYGKIVPLSRQAIVNDDLGAFNDMLSRLGRASAEFEATQLVSLVTQNSGAGPTMGDSVALFHATHGNLAGTGGAISVAALGAARAAMRLQKGLDGKTPIDARPKYLLVPAALETIGEQFLTQLAANQATSANPFSGQLTLIVDPRLDAVSATAWYVAADPVLIDTIEYAYLEEAIGPQLFAREGWIIDGTEFKVRLDWGAAVLDFRGLYRNPGA